MDEGGLRPPPGLTYWQRVWWWFDFLILVKIARLRFAAILVVIGLVITQWDLLSAYYEKWTRLAAGSGDLRRTGEAGGGAYEWFCPMHPSVVRDNPKDKCPICFMPLSKRKKGEGGAGEALPAGVVSRVQVTPYRMVLAGVRTWRVDYVLLSREVVAAGLVEFNERGQRSVAARIKGRIDKLLVNETGQMVDAGDVLAELYSPDLNVTVQNLVQASKLGSRDLLNDARERLELLGIDRSQVDEIVQTGRANSHLKIRSPISGHVIQKFVREGQYVDEGTPLYDVADLSSVWIEAQVYEEDIGLLPVAQEHAHTTEVEKIPVIATTRAFPNEEFRGTLKFVYPHVDQATRTLAVRFEIENPQHKLRPGGTATVKLLVPPQKIAALVNESVSAEQKDELAKGRVLAVPTGAVIDTGEQKIVYREVAPAEFEGVQVNLGPKLFDSEGVAYFPVLSGLAVGDQIVTSGSFLVDAETRLNPAAGSIYFGGSSGAKGVATTTVRATAPDDPEAKIAAVLAKLPPADRALAQQQRTCPILKDSRLGSMGPPIKLTLAGETVFLCCSGCKGQATAEPEKTAVRVRELRGRPLLPEGALGGAMATPRNADARPEGPARQAGPTKEVAR
jgi:Cu(I)/Ag(I) efflux system membrane fusion protein